MRAFIAIPCPDDIANSLVGIQNRIRDLGKLKLIEPGDIHLTLKFLGNVDERRLDRIIECLDGLSGTYCFNISLRGVGAFPKPARARVVWVGVEQGRDEIRKLHASIDQKLNTCGFEKEKRFSPHFTIARVKGIDEREAFIKILDENSKKEFGDFHVGGIMLMKSELKRAGPVYSLIHRFDFK